jgi:hypothetical protein
MDGRTDDEQRAIRKAHLSFQLRWAKNNSSLIIKICRHWRNTTWYELIVNKCHQTWRCTVRRKTQLKRRNFRISKDVWWRYIWVARLVRFDPRLTLLYRISTCLHNFFKSVTSNFEVSNLIKNSRLAAFVVQAVDSFSEKISSGLWSKKYGKW